MLYSYKSNVNNYEVGKMVPYFWKKFYFCLVINYTLINLLISILIFVCFHSIIDAIFFFLSFLIYYLIYCKVKLSDIVTKGVGLYTKKKNINTEINLEFYDLYLVQKKKDKDLKINYDKFNKCIETDTNFYLQYVENNRNKVLIINKNDCEPKLIQLIRIKIKNIDNCLGKEIKFLENSKLENSKFVKVIKILLVTLSIFSLIGGLYTVGMYNELNEINNSNFAQSAWLFWLWLPLPILSLIISYIIQKHKISCSKNIIVSLITCILLIILGCFSLFSNLFNDDNNYNDDYNIIANYEQIMDVKIPSSGQLKIRNMGTFTYNDISNLDVIYVNYKNEDINILTNDIRNNDKWVLSTELPSKFSKLIPFKLLSNDNVYYLFYNKTLDEYNAIPNALGAYRIYTIQYNSSKKNLLIYTFDYKEN